MAKFSDVNTIGTGAAAIFKLKAVLKAAGWTVPSSSDGTTYNSSGDQITVATSGAGGMANNSAWFVIREPGGRREWCFQRGTTNQVWRVKYSALARFTGGSPGATRVPSATDSADANALIGGGTDASPTFGSWFATDSTYRVHITANSTPISGCYPFNLITTISPGSTVSNACCFQEPMAPGSFSAADVDPCVVSVSGSQGAFMVNNVVGWLAYGTGSQTWITFTVNNVITAGSLAADLASGADVNVRPYFTASSGGTRVKGWGSTIGVKGLSRTYPATANTATDAYVYLGNFAIPYPENIVPGV